MIYVYEQNIYIYKNALLHLYEEISLILYCNDILVVISLFYAEISMTKHACTCRCWLNSMY